MFFEAVLVFAFIFLIRGVYSMTDPDRGEEVPQYPPLDAPENYRCPMSGCTFEWTRDYTFIPIPTCEFHYNAHLLLADS